MADVTGLFSEFLPQNSAPANDYLSQLQRTYNEILPGQPLDTGALQNWYGSNQGIPFGGISYSPETVNMAEQRRLAGLLTGGGGGGGDSAQQESAWSQLTPTQQAAFYAANPLFSTITQGLQNVFGKTNIGLLQNAFFPEFVKQQQLIARGIDPNGMAGLSEQERANVNQALSGYLESGMMNYQGPAGTTGLDYNQDFAAPSSGLAGSAMAAAIAAGNMAMSAGLSQDAISAAQQAAYDAIMAGGTEYTAGLQASAAAAAASVGAPVSAPSVSPSELPSYDFSGGGYDSGGLSSQGASADTGLDGIGF